MPEAEPFRIAVPDEEVTDLRRRILATRWPDQMPGSGWTQGAELGYVQDVARYWAEEYDWRRHEAELNAFPQFLVTLQGQQVHFLHVRSAHPDALPLILTHGWPGSVSEFTKVIRPLTEPDDPADAFHVVIPALPGYGFSGPTTEAGWGPPRIASAWAELMALLGYHRYGAQGGDWGSVVSHHLGGVDAEHVCGVHVNMLVIPPSGAVDDFDDMSPREGVGRDRARAHLATGRGYQEIQGTKPQSLAYGLTDSPAGLLGWIVEKFHAWTDNDGNPEDAVSRDELLTNVSIYWFTRTAGSAARLYYEARSAGRVPLPKLTVPLGLASFATEVTPRRRWVERAQPNLVHWSEFDRGGHFAALEEPALLVDDVRAFFRPLRR